MSEISAFGYAYFREHLADNSTIEVARKFGTPTSPWVGEVVQRLVPRKTSTPNTYSGNYGFGAFPFHTDLAMLPRPPRYLLLRCVRGFEDVPTLLIDGIAPVDSDLRNLLLRAVVKGRRPREGRVTLLRLREESDQGVILRWDNLFLRPASKLGGLAIEKFSEMLAGKLPVSIALVRRGDTLLVDNWRMLHSRSRILGKHQGRIIERVYLESLN
jgi:L-asparagine oxygenase